MSRVRENRTHGSTGGDWKRNATASPRQPPTQPTSAYRHPTVRAITSHCARRCPLLWFLTFDKPETLSDNDVRLLRPQTHPRNGQKSPKTEGLIAIDDASYFLSKIELTKGGAPSMPAWRQNLFIATSKLSADSAESFCLHQTEP